MPLIKLKVAEVGCFNMKKLANIFEEVLSEAKITYNIEHIDGYSGQDNYELGMYINGEIVGMVQYVIFRGELTVSDIIVRPEFRRKGFGSRMMQYLKQEHPDAKYTPSFKTELGSKFNHKTIYGKLDSLDELKNK